MRRQQSRDGVKLSWTQGAPHAQITPYSVTASQTFCASNAAKIYNAPISVGGRIEDLWSHFVRASNNLLWWGYLGNAALTHLKRQRKSTITSSSRTDCLK
jgi:hypothetical protein